MSSLDAIQLWIMWISLCSNLATLYYASLLPISPSGTRDGSFWPIKLHEILQSTWDHSDQLARWGGGSRLKKFNLMFCQPIQKWVYGGSRPLKFNLLLWQPIQEGAYWGWGGGGSRLLKINLIFCDLNEPTPTSVPWRMNGKWSGNGFLFRSSSLTNHGGYSLVAFFTTYLLTTHKEVISR